MSKHLQRDIDHLNHELLSISSMVEEMIDKATQALSRAPLRLADEVVSSDEYRRSARGPRRGRVPEDARPASAGGGRSAADRDGAEGQQRPGADRRPGGEHRPAGPGDGRVSRVSRFPTGCREMVVLATQMVRGAMDAFVNMDHGRGPPDHRRWTARSISYNRDIIDELQALMQKRPELVPAALHCFSGRPPHRADRRPRHEHRRGRDLPRRRRHRPPPHSNPSRPSHLNQLA